MALPMTVAEVLAAVKAALVARTWPASIDATTPVVWPTVEIVYGFEVNAALDLVTNLPAALVIDGGQRYESQENPEFATTVVRIVMLTRQTGTRGGALAIQRDKGLQNMQTELRKALRYHAALGGDAHFVAGSSGSAILSSERHGRDVIAKEVVVDVFHQDVLKTDS